MDSTSNERGNAFLTATVSGTGNTLATAPDCAKVQHLQVQEHFVFRQRLNAPENVVSYLIVGGGAGGGGNDGGGGGGGVREVDNPLHHILQVHYKVFVLQQIELQLQQQVFQ